MQPLWDLSQNKGFEALPSLGVATWKQFWTVMEERTNRRNISCESFKALSFCGLFYLVLCGSHGRQFFWVVGKEVESARTQLALGLQPSSFL